MMSFRKQTFENYMTISGLIVVVENDIHKTMEKLAHYKKEGKVTGYLDQSIGKMLSKVEKKQRKLVERSRHVIEELDEEKRKEFKKVEAMYMKRFAGKTLLYDPLNPDSKVVKIFTWFGNLTWGAINSLVGFGFVVAAAIVSPFTRHVDFPTLRLSSSGSQIYADVSGMLPFRGKISFGIFETDYNAGYRFASAHEAGHATQSALLGPLYLPAALLSYILVGGHGGFIEEWADAWAHFHS
jgi:hypothetical protein